MVGDAVAGDVVLVGGLEEEVRTDDGAADDAEGRAVGRRVGPRVLSLEGT